MAGLFPEIEPYDSGRLRVDSVHSVYFEQCGNPEGKPAIFVHGGPGGGSSSVHRRFWDPAVYRIILFDQRGCGRSTPHAELRNNTTWDLVEDMERIRAHLGIERWQLFGGSWGSTLALAYAQQYPDRVTEMVLRGIFLLRRREIQWYYQEGASRIFPEAWQGYLEPIPQDERDDMVGAYYRRLTSNDRTERIRAARAWSMWEGSTSRLVPDPELIKRTGDETFAEAFARIECHYFINGGFFQEDNYLLQNAHRIEHIPMVIVQGRYDIVCPPESAYQLHQACPNSTLIIAQKSGHSALEPEITTHLIAATTGQDLPP
ncbi:MAG: prolyl aminopeptidase [Deltaproteobacteria bacterium]|jgi:proline iminopeptidase|nr:prolyl aminopeptidase [Deltaproteobacteria bacterium]MBW2214940.1 prolyl aminopeptidase [Deltaproteobacteria bacterium]MBW2380782.1 prolyl aminopeptidase [Deltaproteobacteria bacterium]MBW2627277.1 prolyl aminopeptidase [Deltaproteobacteria bacterium]RLB42266.1 MAG: prolyl aminopeptidase [Deltaproteobacteria bacterium]